MNPHTITAGFTATCPGCGRSIPAGQVMCPGCVRK
jgi:NMD protein affecting ribosome stability and mRNA decay